MRCTRGVGGNTEARGTGDKAGGKRQEAQGNTEGQVYQLKEGQRGTSEQPL
jgi:hypothetical protein